MTRNSWLQSNHNAHRLQRDLYRERWERGEILGKDIPMQYHPLSDKAFSLLAQSIVDGFVVIDRRDNRARNTLRTLGYVTITDNIGSACQCEVTELGTQQIPTWYTQSIVDERKRNEEIRERIRREDEIAGGASW